MSCKTILGKYAEKLEREIKKMNKEIELLYKKLDAQDKIIDEQALEISQLKNQKQQVIEYMNSLEFLELMNSENKEDYFKAKSKLLEILGG